MLRKNSVKMNSKWFHITIIASKIPFFSFHTTSCNFSNIHQLSICKASRINSVLKTEQHDNIAYRWENKIIMILEHLQIFVTKTAAILISGWKANVKTQCCNNVSFWQQQRYRQDNIGTMLRQPYPTSRPKFNHFELN